MVPSADALLPEPHSFGNRNKLYRLMTSVIVRATPQREAFYSDLISSHGDDVSMICLAQEDTSKRILEHVEHFGVKCPQACIGSNSNIPEDYRVSGGGHYFVVDRRGRVAAIPEVDNVKVEIELVKNAVAAALDAPSAAD